MTQWGLFVSLAGGLHALLLLAGIGPAAAAEHALPAEPVWMSLAVGHDCESAAAAAAPAAVAASPAIEAPRVQPVRAKARAKTERKTVERAPATEPAVALPEPQAAAMAEAIAEADTNSATDASAVAEAHAASDAHPAAGSEQAGLDASAAGDASSGSGATQRRAAGASGHAGTTRAPGLLVFGAPCAGYFPSMAATDDGEARIDVEVDARGRVHAARVLAEHPAHQGFGTAARACAAHLQFAPARDATGSAVPGHATLALRFHRG